MVKAKATGPDPQDVGEAGTPLHYMLEVMNDPEASPARRDRMAIAAAAYLHRRALESGIKAQRKAAAQRVAKSPRLARSKVPSR